MGGAPDKDSKADSVTWGPGRVKVGMLGLKGHHGCYLSWSVGGGCRANETKLSTQETWTMDFQESSGMVTFAVGDGSTNRYLCARENGMVNCEGNNGYHGGIFWRAIANADGTVSFKSIYDYYLCLEPPHHSTRLQVQANRGELQAWEKVTIEAVSEFKTVDWKVETPPIRY